MAWKFRARKRRSKARLESARRRCAIQFPRSSHAESLAPGETGIVVSHGAALRTVVPEFLGWGGDPDESLGVLANCGWVELEHGSSAWTGGAARWRLTAWNRVA